MSSGDDEEAFRQAMADVVPKRQSKKTAAGRCSRTLEPTLTQAQRRLNAEQSATSLVDPNYLTLGKVKALDPLETLSWKKDGVQIGVFRKFRAGGYEVEAELDLHGRTVREARADVYAFLEHASRKGWRLLLIAHGKGEKSDTPARLKSYVAHWLAQAPEVIAYHSAVPAQGGVGAVYCMLRKNKAIRSEKIRQ